ncbi:MAG: hypothetical protein WC887_02805 [Candidatus Paceibacterota bacterium]|jgi:Tfp pilus assembly protein PilO
MNNHILPSIALLFAIGIFFFYVKPTWSGPIAEAKIAIVNDDQALVAAEKYTAQQNQLASERNAIDPANLAKLNVLLPDSVDNVGIIVNLNALAARSGFSLSNIDVTSSSANTQGVSSEGTLPISDTSPTSSVDLSLSAVGTYASFQSFLTGIEKSQRILDVQNITVSGSETGIYKYSMTLRLYWLR